MGQSARRQNSSPHSASSVGNAVPSQHLSELPHAPPSCREVISFSSGRGILLPSSIEESDLG